MKNIVVPIDFSDVSKQVIERASLLAKVFTAKMWLIHVVAPDPDFVGYNVGPQEVRDSVANEIKKEHRQLQELATKIEQEGVDVTPLLVQGPTVETILKQTEKREADMVVMGSHGCGVLRRMLLGSVSEGVLRECQCPLMIIPKDK